MPISAGALRDLHRIHRQSTDLRERLARGPRQVKAQEDNIKKCEADLAKAKDDHKKARMLADERQLQLKEREDHVEKLKVQLNMCSTNKEFQALKEQIAADEQATSVLSDEILETLEKIDTLDAAVKTADATKGKVKEELEKTRARVAEQQATLETELARVTGELEKVEANIPSDFKPEYDRMISGRGEDALAQVDGETCGGCFQLLTPQTMNELMMGQPVFCKSCARLLYLPEDRTVGS